MRFPGLTILRNGQSWELHQAGQSELGGQVGVIHTYLVDLNPIRARLADRPETSELTSAHERIMALFHEFRRSWGQTWFLVQVSRFAAGWSAASLRVFAIDATVSLACVLRVPSPY